MPVRGDLTLNRVLPFGDRRYVMNGTMESRNEQSGFEIWRAVINLGGLVIVAGMIVLIVATIVTG